MATKKARHGLPPAPVRGVGRPVIYQPPIGPVDLPCSDGMPMADNTVQARAMVYSHNALERHFAGPEEVFVAIDLLLYYIVPETGKTESVDPDLMVVFGVERRDRLSYKVWREGGRVPDFVMEIVSPRSGSNDLVAKPGIYAWLGVTEYFVYDPFGRTVGTLMARRLEGNVLRAGSYEPIEPRADGSIRSAVLGLDLRLRKEEGEDGFRGLRFRDPGTGRDLETHMMLGAGMLRERRARAAAEDRESEAQERARRERLDRIQAQEQAAVALEKVAELEALLKQRRAGGD